MELISCVSQLQAGHITWEGSDNTYYVHVKDEAVWTFRRHLEGIALTGQARTRSRDYLHAKDRKHQRI